MVVSLLEVLILLLGSPPKTVNSKNRVFIGSQRRDSVDEAPPDMAAVLFTAKLEGLGITKEDQSKLLKMRDYLNSMTRAMLSYAFYCDISLLLLMILLM